jgi:hypothetical protein
VKASGGLRLGGDDLSHRAVIAEGPALADGPSRAAVAFSTWRQAPMEQECQSVIHNYSPSFVGIVVRGQSYVGITLYEMKEEQGRSRTANAAVRQCPLGSWKGLPDRWASISIWAH